MLSQSVDHSWDLTPVIDLIYTLSSNDDPFIADNGSLPSAVTRPTVNGEDEHSGGEQRLGNFNKLWEFLGQPYNTPPPIIEPTTPALGDNLPDDGWSSTGEPGNCSWQVEPQSTDLPRKKDLRALLPIPQWNKKQKKSKKKQHGDVLSQEVELASYGGLPIIKASSGEDSDTGPRQAPRCPDRRSVIYEILYGNTLNGRNSTLSGDFIPLGASSPLKDAKTHKLKDWQITNTSQQKARWQPDLQGPMSAAAKKAKLVLDLCERLPAERNSIMALGPAIGVPTSSCLPVTAVHVFIDVSNVSLSLELAILFLQLTSRKIMIGFHDSFKVSRGLSISTRIPRIPFSFHNLTLILERGRPTAKRVLVGSDKFAVIDEAKQLGYETNILDRVHKAKELTPRQKKFMNGKGASEQSSGSETTAVYAPQKWVEQAVDEILHLKMMESIIDVKEPSTMILATGDAAEAEYSQGFLKMVERALEKGWKVELVSFRQNTSGAYKRREFRSKWGEMFKIIELDDYTEELVAL